MVTDRVADSAWTIFRGLPRVKNFKRCSALPLSLHFWGIRRLSLLHLARQYVLNLERENECEGERVSEGGRAGVGERDNERARQRDRREEQWERAVA